MRRRLRLTGRAIFAVVCLGVAGVLVGPRSMAVAVEEPVEVPRLALNMAAASVDTDVATIKAVVIENQKRMGVPGGQTLTGIIGAKQNQILADLAIVKASLSAYNDAGSSGSSTFTLQQFQQAMHATLDGFEQNTGNIIRNQQYQDRYKPLVEASEARIIQAMQGNGSVGGLDMVHLSLEQLQASYDDGQSELMGAISAGFASVSQNAQDPYSANILAELQKMRNRLASPDCDKPGVVTSSPWQLFVPSPVDHCAMTRQSQGRETDRVIRALEKVHQEQQRIGNAPGLDTGPLEQATRDGADIVKDAVDRAKNGIEAGVKQVADAVKGVKDVLVGNPPGAFGTGTLPMPARLTAWMNSFRCLSTTLGNHGSGSDPTCSTGPTITIPTTTVTWSPLSWCGPDVGFSRIRDMIGWGVVLAGAFSCFRAVLAAFGMAASVPSVRAHLKGD